MVQEFQAQLSGGREGQVLTGPTPSPSTGSNQTVGTGDVTMLVYLAGKAEGLLVKYRTWVSNN